MTEAGDFNKWAIAWHHQNDTLIMKSSDVSSYAWKIIDNKFEKIEMDSLLYQDGTRVFESKFSM